MVAQPVDQFENLHPVWKASGKSFTRGVRIFHASALLYILVIEYSRQ